jgi:hypothetical protein
MKKILFIENLTDEKSSKVDHAIAIAEKKDLELAALFVIPVRQDAPSFPEVQAEQIEKAETKVNQFAEKKAAELKDSGRPFAWKVVQSTATLFMEAMEAFTPVDVIVSGNIDLDPLAEKGIKTLEDISTRFGCPVLPVEGLLTHTEKKKGQSIFRFLVLAALSAMSYLVFFPYIDKLNHLIFMKGTILGGLAVMAVVPVHAYIYGSFTEYFPRWLGMEKSAGKH